MKADLKKISGEWQEGEGLYLRFQHCLMELAKADSSQHQDGPGRTTHNASGPYASLWACLSQEEEVTDYRWEFSVSASRIRVILQDTTS